MARRSPGTAGGRYSASVEDESRETGGRQVLLHGRVLDPLRAPVPAAAVTVISAVPHLSTVSDAQGEFTLPLGRDVYSIEILAEGFRKLSRSLDLRQGDLPAIEFSMQIEGLGETVVVSDACTYRSAVTASGTRTLTTLLELPQSVTVIPQDLVRDQLISSIAELVRYVPGITAHQGENNSDQLVIRGNSSSADFMSTRPAQPCLHMWQASVQNLQGTLLHIAMPTVHTNHERPFERSPGWDRKPLSRRQDSCGSKTAKTPWMLRRSILNPIRSRRPFLYVLGFRRAHLSASGFLRWRLCLPKHPMK